MNEKSIVYTLDSWYILLPLALITLAIFLIWKNKTDKKFTIGQYIVLVSFGIYVVAVLHLVFFPIEVNIGPYANQTPWHQTANFIPVLTIDIPTFLLNIIMMIPFGMYIPFLFKQVTTIKKAVMIGLLISLSFEVIQALLFVIVGSGRSSDVNDLIANTLGTLVGFVITNSLTKVSAFNRLFQYFKITDSF